MTRWRLIRESFRLAQGQTHESLQPRADAVNGNDVSTFPLASIVPRDGGSEIREAEAALIPYSPPLAQRCRTDRCTRWHPTASSGCPWRFGIFPCRR